MGKEKQPTVESAVQKPGVYFGFDLSKSSVDVASRQTGLGPVQKKDLRNIKTRRYERSRKGIQLWWQEVSIDLEPDQRVTVVMEVTSSYSLETAAWLKAACPEIGVVIIPGKRIREWTGSIGVNYKNDSVDARVIACYGAERQPESYVPMDETYAKLRALCRTRLVLVEQSNATQLRLEEACGEHLDRGISKIIQRTLTSVLKELGKQIQALEKQMKELVDSDAQLASDVAMLDTINGVGWHTAVTVLAELGDLRNYKKRTSLVSRAGLNPVERESGTSVKKRPRISKQGSCRARRALFLAALSCIRGESVFREMYGNLLQRGKKKMVSIVAVMRKLLLVMRAVIISGKPFDPSIARTQAIISGT